MRNLLRFPVRSLLGSDPCQGDSTASALSPKKYLVLALPLTSPATQLGHTAVWCANVPFEGLSTLSAISLYNKTFFLRDHQIIPQVSQSLT